MQPPMVVDITSRTAIGRRTRLSPPPPVLQAFGRSTSQFKPLPWLKPELLILGVQNEHQLSR